MTRASPTDTSKPLVAMWLSWIPFVRHSPSSRAAVAVLAGPVLAGSLGQDEPGDEAGQENERRCHGQGEYPS